MFSGHITLDGNKNQAIKNIYFLYSNVSEQYKDLEMLEQIKPLGPEHILQSNEDDKIKKCSKCGYEYTFPRYGKILKIAEMRTGRCSEWSMLFGAIMNALKTETRIVHDFLDHCWNETIIDGKWVHMDSTLAYPISI